MKPYSQGNSTYFLFLENKGLRREFIPKFLSQSTAAQRLGRNLQIPRNSARWAC
jgi:hypothetical protein